MTTTTPEQARKLAAYREKRGDLHAQIALINIADQVDALTKERDELRIQIDIQAGSIEAVQAANQRLAANHKECVRCLGEALQDTANVSVERDALAAELARPETTAVSILRAERDALALVVDQWKVDFHELSLERDELRRQSDLQMNSAIKFCQERNAARIERDAALEQNTELDARCAKLEAAGKLALEAMEQIHPYDLDCLSEIAALRQAGVQ